MRILPTVFCLLSMLAFSACASLLRPQGKRAELTLDEGSRLHRFLDELLATHLDSCPMQAASQGFREGVPAWDNLSEAHLDRIRACLETASERLKSGFQTRNQVLPPGLRTAAEDWISWEIEADDWRHHSDLLSQLHGAHHLPARVLWSKVTPRTPAEWDHYLNLLRSLPDYLAQLETRLRTRADHQTLPPKQVMLRARTSCLAWLAGRPFTTLSSARSPWQIHAQDQLGLSPLLGPIESARLSETVDRILSQDVGPAFRNLASTLDDLLSAAPESVAARDRQGGADWYRYRLKRVAGEPVDPDELQNLGLREVARLRDRIRATQTSRGQSAPLAELLQAVQESEAYARAQPENWTSALESWQPPARERVASSWPKLTLASLEFVSDELQALLRGQIPPTPLSYHLATPGLSIAGGAWKNIPAIWIEPQLAAEGLPGAHLRTAAWATNKDLPQLVRSMEIPARAQGWDLYATRLANEWRLYSGPDAELGQALWELWCAALLVADTGLHHKGWSAKEAEEYLEKNSPLSRSLCSQAVRDIWERPGERCAPTLGLQQILDLREWGSAQLGQKFDLTEFHRTILAAGPVPMGSLRAQVQAWIGEQGKQP